MRELLFLAHRIPYPPTKGDKIRSYHILKQLARDYRVHLGAFIDDPADWRHVPAVQALCDETCFVRLRPLAARLKSLAALGRGAPLTLPYYRSRRLQAWVDALLARGTVRRTFVFSSSMAQYLERPPDPAIRRVLDFVDIDSDKWRQYARTRAWPLSWLYGREARCLSEYERHCAGVFDASVFVSAAEARLFSALAPEAANRVSYVENGVDTEYFSPARTYPDPYGRDERAIVFTGAMDYWANVDAVAWFAADVFPRVRAAVPRAAFYIVGARPGGSVRALAARAGVRVTGRVEDVRPHLAHARLAVAPLRIARGVQNKVLEAMAMGRPVLASAQAVEGLRLDASLRALVCADADAFAAQTVRLLTEGDREGLGEAGRTWVARHYAWSVNASPIARLLDGEAAAAPAPAAAGGA